MAKPKAITVNIKGDYPETRKVTPTFTSEGKTILVMKEATEITVGWSIDVTGAISRDIKGKQCIDVIRGDRFPIEYKTVDHDKTIRNSIFPFLSLDHIKEFADMEIFKKGVSNVRQALEKLTPLMWISLILIIIVAIMAGINIYMANNIINAVGKIPLPTPVRLPTAFLFQHLIRVPII
jgi:hypothetical protein